jgi:hypothetical protein
MATLEFLLAAILDPVQAALVLALILAYRGPLPIVVVATAAAVASETVTVLAAADFAWGETLLPRLIASLVQTAVLHSGIRLIWPSRAGGAAQQQGAEPSRRLAPWHMRAFVRRRLSRLR